MSLAVADLTLRRSRVIRSTARVRAFTTLQNLPRLVVLISCQSGGNGSAGESLTDRAVLSAIGPRLAEAGVPAVLAMQGNLLIQTARDFLQAPPAQPEQAGGP